MLQTIICAVATVAASQPAVLTAMQEVYIQIEFEDPDGLDNRGPLCLPFYGRVNTLSGNIELFFTSPCGSVQVELKNLDDNTSINTVINGTGVAIIPFAGSTGQWQLKLTFASGTEYVGEFTI